MAVLKCAAGEWTNIPDLGEDQVIEAREKGLYVDTTGALPIAQAAEGIAVPGLESIVVKATLFGNPVRVTPSNPLKAASCRHSPI